MLGVEATPLQVAWMYSVSDPCHSTALHGNVPIIYHMFGTPMSRQALRSSPSSLTPQIGLILEATSGPQMALITSTGPENLR